jgi:glutathione S-transferase
MYTLYGRPGSGSAACEAILRLAKAQVKIIDIERRPEGSPAPELLAVNPLGQVPTMVMSDGSVMTESAAICIYLADLHADAGLAPLPTDHMRASYLRWMIYLSASVYMSELRYFYPHRYTTDPNGADAIKASATARKDLEWSVFADALGDKPFTLGEDISAVDIYAAMLLSWIDDLDAFFVRHPNLGGFYRRVAAAPGIAPVWLRHGMPA